MRAFTQLLSALFLAGLAMANAAADQEGRGRRPDETGAEPIARSSADVVTNPSPVNRKSLFSFNASCEAKCKDDVCRQFRCFGDVEASTESEARLKAAIRLRAEVSSGGGKTETIFNVSISVSKRL